MARFTRWVIRNADGALALVAAVAAALISLIDVFSNAVDLKMDYMEEATLLVLALLAVAVLRDRNATARAVNATAAVRLLNGSEVGRALAEGRNDTHYWNFKGGTGTYLRAVTFPECIKIAQSEKRPLRMQIEIIDPANEVLCNAYAQFRSSLAPGPDGTGEPWTFDRTRKESYATVLAACWYRRRFTFLEVEVGLSTVMTTFRWDMSASRIIMTQEDGTSPSLMFEAGKPHFRAYSRELVASFKQARRIPLDQADAVPLSEEPTVEETRKLFAAVNLDLPATMTNRDITEIIRKARHPRNPYR
ncbi:hypothetical protein [Rhizohabitans arisaemae]|uniref:hypothetical protein n=1 Tax=Rhizohabitans arisaemae TaxID=2720610 RepID=UPI0024B25DA9|nr:hypothetical protein [Rhizohabitans arisaemae]